MFTVEESTVISNVNLVQKKLWRKRKANPENSVKNCAKKACNLGMSYELNNEEIVCKRKIGPSYSNCRFHCNEKVTGQERLNMFKDY